MPGLRRGKHRDEVHKKRVLLDGPIEPAVPASRPRAFQMPAVSPAPFAPRSTPEPGISPDLPLWPGWHADPTRRHESRYFDGVSWTDHVGDGKEYSTDPYSMA